MRGNDTVRSRVCPSESSWTISSKRLVARAAGANIDTNTTQVVYPQLMQRLLRSRHHQDFDRLRRGRLS